MAVREVSGSHPIGRRERIVAREDEPQSSVSRSSRSNSGSVSDARSFVLADEVKLTDSECRQCLLGIRLDDFDYEGGVLCCEALERRCDQGERGGLECPHAEIPLDRLRLHGKVGFGSIDCGKYAFGVGGGAVPASVRRTPRPIFSSRVKPVSRSSRASCCETG